MTNCCLGMLRGIWSFLMGSLRLILFFLCIIYILSAFITLAMLISVDSSPNAINLPGYEVHARDYMMVFGMIILGLVGAYGAFYRHHPSIRAFSLASALTTLLLVMMLIYVESPQELAQKHKQMFEQLQGDMKLYSWDHEPATKKSEEVTKMWDDVQRIACCGVEGPNDWIDYRPSSSKYNSAYPSSCCLHSSGATKSVCTKQDLFFTDGCSQRFSQIIAVAIMLKVIGVAFQLALSIISYMVGSCSFESRAEQHMARQAMSLSVPRDQAIYVDRHYQQPSMGQQYGSSPSAPKQSLPPMYPNLHASNDVNYSAPPPSYGT